MAQETTGGGGGFEFKAAVGPKKDPVCPSILQMDRLMDGKDSHTMDFSLVKLPTLEIQKKQKRVKVKK